MSRQLIKSLLLAGLLVAAPVSVTFAADANSATKLQTQVEALGQLNGTALACQQLALSTRIRDILIDQAPKERGVGEWFESATQARYLSFGKEGHTCPDSKTLANAIEQARSSFQR